MNECEHKTGTVLLDVSSAMIVKCDYGCGALLVTVKINGEPLMDYEIEQPELAALRKIMAVSEEINNELILHTVKHLETEFSSTFVSNHKKLTDVLEEYRAAFGEAS